MKKYKKFVVGFLALNSMMASYSETSGIQSSGKYADSCIGFIGGILGGLGGFCGSLPSAWVI